VTDISRAAGRVVGVVAEGPDGPLEYRADALLIASGGFNNNLEMVQRYATDLPRGSRVLLGGAIGARGEGHRLLEALGAQLVNLEAVWMYPYATPDYRDPSGQRGLVVRGLEGDVWVNSQGRRFHDESKRGGATGLPALLAQDPPTCWSIIDARIAARFNVADPAYRARGEPLRDQLYRLLEESSFIARGNSIAELGATTGLDAGALGRPLAGLEPLDAPPFYALQFFPLARKNLGGVRTDLRCQVLGADDRPIPGLFAAGEVAGMAGGRINGRNALEGTMFGPSIFSGRIAGQAMAEAPTPL
jgi:predicted oxidoreductase